MPRKRSRRDFLKGRPAADVVADALQGAASEAQGSETPSSHRAVPLSETAPPPNQQAGGGYLVHITRQAMACEFEVQLNAGQYADGTEMALEALDLVDAIEDRLSIFRESSETNAINRMATDGPVAVTPEVFALLETALRLYAESDGAFDITATPLWEVWGFARRNASIPSEQQIAKALEAVGSRHMVLDRENCSIQLKQPGVRISFGSIGKGHALDRCAAMLREAGIDDFLLHGGQSSVLACGSRQSPRRAAADASEGWVVGVSHPLRPNRRIAEIRLRDRALATSGAWAQSFVHQGHRYGHILDPRSGWPAEGVLSATAVAPTAALADALATAFFVMGPDRAIAFCRERPELGALIVRPVRHSGGIAIETVGFAADDVALFHR